MRSSSFRAAAALLAVVLVSGCGFPERKPVVSYRPEAFGSTTTHTRSFAATEAQTCEAARRALLSQGYVLAAANTELVTGRKSFQPAPEVHVEMEFRVVCAREGGAPRGTVVFASALQDRYGVRKVNNSASVGVGALGSISLPFASSDDAMVKVASETLSDDRFYDSFFALVERYLPASIQDVPPPPEARPAPPAASAAPAETRPVAPERKPEDAPPREAQPLETRG
jgi:hypothetical protein